MAAGWSGNLLASRDADAWQSVTPNVSLVTFHCPSCDEEWHARAIGDDVEALPLDPKELEQLVWPPQDLGGGD